MPYGPLPTPMRWIGRLFLGLGLLLLIVGAWAAVGEARWLAKARHTTGEIVDLRIETMTDSNGRSTGTGYRVIFRFTAPDGRQITVPSKVVTSSTSYRPGDRVEIDYHPDRPGGAELPRWADRWLVPTILAGIGAIMALLGGLAAFSRRNWASGGQVWTWQATSGPGDGPSPGDGFARRDDRPGGQDHYRKL